MTRHRPPMNPRTDEVTPDQMQAARSQGAAYGAALQLMVRRVAQGGAEQRAGDYLVGYAVEAAEGMYELRDGELVWADPGDTNCHLEVTVRDGGDGRFVPALTVQATLVDAEGREVGTHPQPMLWHPMMYHYGRNWKVPGDGVYTLRVRIEPAPFMRHDRINGRRFAEPVTCRFSGVKISTGREE